MNLYLSGPMTGMPNLNRPRFRDAAMRLTEAGHMVYDPCEKNFRSYEDAMTADINMLTCCVPDGRGGLSTGRVFDAVVQLPGWEESRGATLEAAVAMACGIRVMTLEEALA